MHHINQFVQGSKVARMFEKQYNIAVLCRPSGNDMIKDLLEAIEHHSNVTYFTDPKDFYKALKSHACHFDTLILGNRLMGARSKLYQSNNLGEIDGLSFAEFIHTIDPTLQIAFTSHIFEGPRVQQLLDNKVIDLALDKGSCDGEEFARWLEKIFE